jgi:hypothetical protein
MKEENIWWVFKDRVLYGSKRPEVTEKIIRNEELQNVSPSTGIAGVIKLSRMT